MHIVQINFYTLVFLFILALLFDFMNGFHDAANAIATVVSTGVLKPQTAVIMTSIFNLSAVFIFHQLHVAASIGKGIIDPTVVDHVVVFGALISAIFWNLITWYYGIPSSSSHALIGGLVGAAVAKAGTSALMSIGLFKIILFIVLSPILGFFFGSAMMLLIFRIFVHFTPRKIDIWFRRAQLISASMYSLGHGGNDAQKTIGIIWMLLIASGYSNVEEPPIWVIINCYCAISIGTLFGGWRIVKTMGQKLTKLKPVSGFCAEIGGAITLFIATSLGIPVSTTHTITGAIVGVGASRKMSAVRWNVAGNIIWAWIFTIPASAFFAAIAWWIGMRIL